MRSSTRFRAIIAIAGLFIFTVAYADNSFNREDVVRFTRALALVKEYGVQETADKKLLENAISGMLQGIDAHSDYLDADTYKSLTESTQGQFAGLGIEITVDKGLIKIIAPLDNSPASKGGLKPGDYILKINNKSVRNMTLNESVKMMRGKIGSKVTLTVLRKQQSKPLTFNLKREMVRVVSVKSELLSDGFGYMRISQFGEKTTNTAKKVLAKLQKQNKGKPLKGLILDLRNNPGGLLDSAVTISDLFLDANKIKQYGRKIVFTKGRHEGAHMSATMTPGDLLKGAPIIILINPGSASASEIVSGALQDYKRAVIMGEKSFGKGSVQTVLPLDKNHAIKLTTALYYTPSGRKIQAKGVKPDIAVENLKLKEKNTKALIIQPLKEAKAKGYIKNSQFKQASKQAMMNSNKKLARKDYQLYQALNVLKALNTTNTALIKKLARNR